MAVLFSSVVSAKVEPYPQSSWFEQDPAPIPIVSKSIGNPLDYAGARIGLDVRNVELPRGWEGAYRYICRFPIIDYVSNRPLYMKQWAETRSASLVAFHRENGVGAVEFAGRVLIGNDGEGEMPYASSAHRIARTSDRDAENEFEMLRVASKDSLRVQLVRSGFTSKYADAVAELCRALHRSDRSCREAVAGLPTGDPAFLAENPGRYLAPDGRHVAEITGNTDAQLDFIRRARRFDCGKVLGAVPWVRRAIDRYLSVTRGWSKTDFYSDTSMTCSTAALDLPLGRVEIAGFGDDRHVEDAALLIDLGGNDVYTNNAGGCGREGGVALCIDHSGDDKYLAPDSSYVQGFGFLGIGMLVDLAGNDAYRAKHFSQGAGILGVGVLWDKAGNDTFSAHTFCQGAGMFGLGMMLDDSGDDVYDCASNGQGSATTLGLGILSDLEGNDKYRLACDSTKDAMGGIPGYGQGGALSFRAYPWEKKLVAYGGVGMLVDDKGNDDYVSKGWNCQGGSYIMSLGVLVDNEGNDHYDCGTGQGSGIHVTNAILIDKKGDDVYEGGFRAGGSGSDRSPGFLIDYEGNDTYKSNTSSFGTACKPFAYTLFIDYKGDDKYICEKPKGPVLMNDWHSFGGVWPESDPNAWPYAICLDLGGKDDYQVRNRSNNSETHSFGHGIFLDVEWKGGDIIGKVERPWKTMNTYWRSSRARWMERLGDDPVSTFSAVGNLVADSAAPADVAQLVVRTAEAGYKGAVRGGLECLHHWFVQGKIGDKELPEVLKLLKARDPEVRTIIADDLGLWKLPGCEDALIEAAKSDSNAQVRRFALRSLIRLESAKALPVAWRLAGNDTSEDVRRMAVNLIGKVRPSGEVLPLLVNVLESDKASSVRCAAADAIGSIGEPAGIEPLRRAARGDMTDARDITQSPRGIGIVSQAPARGTVPTFADVYLQRACGRALCYLGQVEGIQLLINSMSFPSIDAFYNYDRNVPNYVSAFAGFDLPDSERYVQAKWQAWFDTHRDSINVRANADAYKAWTRLSDSLRDLPDTAQVPRYEAFLVRFPTYERAKKELAGKLNGIAWNFATAPKARDITQSRRGIGIVSQASPASRALKYALRAAELSDDPNIWDTVIEAYLANGRKADALRVCHEALAKHPSEKMLKDRLKQLE